MDAMLAKIQEGRKAPQKPKKASSLEEQKIINRSELQKGKLAD